MRSLTWMMLGMCGWLAAGAMSPSPEGFETREGTVAFEDFDSYGDQCPIASDGFEVQEYPMGRKHLARVAEGPAWVFRENWPAVGAGEVQRDYEVSFRFTMGSEKREVQLRLDTGGPGKVASHKLVVSADRVQLAGPAGGWGASQQTLLADVGMAPFMGRTWYRCLVQVHGDSLRVFLEDRGELVKVAENTCPEGAFAGLNLLAHSGGQVTALRLRKLEPIAARTRRGSAGESIAEVPVEVSIPVAAGANAVGVWFSAGQAPCARLSLLREDGTAAVISPAIRADSMTRWVEKEGKRTAEKVNLPDAVVDFRELKLQYHSRPFARRYTDEQAEVLERQWASFPAASTRLIHFEARLDTAGAQIWIDGRYAGRLDSPSPVRELKLLLPSGAASRDPRSYRLAEDAARLPLDTAFIARPGALAQAEVSLAPGLQEVAGVPMIVTGGAASAAIDAVKEMKGSWALEADEFLARTAFDGMPESLQFSVPLATWNRAWVLCAAEADPGRDAVLTARLTRSATSGRGDAIADTSILLPRGEEPPAANLKQVGTVAYEAAGGKVTVPLWLAEIPLDAGSILDLVTDGNDPHAGLRIGPYLDFSLLGKLDRAYQQLDRRHKPDAQSASGVHVFGVTLGRSPIAFKLAPSQPGNLFHNDQPAMTTALLTADRAGEGGLTWEILDDTGRVIGSEQRRVTLEAGRETAVDVSLAMPDPGWYGLRFTVTDDRGEALLTHDAAFALLGRDRRRAGYESPYGTWWFGGAHYSCGDLEIIGPMMAKAGLRRTTFGWSKAGEADMAAWKVSLNQVGRGFRMGDQFDPAAAFEREEKRVNELLARFPHCQYVLIFHESYNNQVPPELRDAPAPTPDPARAAQDQQMVELARLAGKFYREKFPQLKQVWGNTSCSASIVAMLLRNGLDASYIDYIGIETPGQTAPPEKLWEGTTQGVWLAREAARKLGHDLPVTACYEFTARSERDLGLRRHAEWVARDVLIGLAYRFPTISPAILHDVGNAYYNTLWGAGGLCRRAPLLYPKPAYVAMATLTNVLDGVTLRRELPTGSATVHGLEFDRAGEHVYAFWTVRGEATLELEVGGEAAATRIDMMGRETAVRTANGRLTVAVSTSPCYVVSPAPVRSAAVTRRVYPADQPGGDFQVASAMDDATGWALDTADRSLESLERTYLPWRTAGTAELRQVPDTEKGACLELELKPRSGPALAPTVGEYAVLRLKTPAPVNGTPRTLGVWVKGNSNWGGVTWEFVDREGEVWRSSGTGGWGCDIVDWPGETAVNFDGWCFLRMPLDEASPARTINPGGVVSQWVCAGGGNKRIDFPIRLTALAVTMYRQTLNLTDMKPVDNLTLRFRDLGALDFAP